MPHQFRYNRYTALPGPAVEQENTRDVKMGKSLMNLRWMDVAVVSERALARR